MNTTVRLISIIAIVIALPLVAAPWWWPSVVTSRQDWTEQQAKEYTHATANYHRLAHEAGHAADQAARQAGKTNPAASASTSSSPKDPATEKAEKLSLEASDALARYNRDHAALDKVRTKGQSAAMVMRYVGIASFIAGWFGWAASRPPSAAT